MRFGGLKDKLENESLSGYDNYPKDQAELLHIMNKYKTEVARVQQNHKKNTEGLAFVQAGAEKGKSDKANSNEACRQAVPARPNQIRTTRFLASTVVQKTTGSTNARY